MTRKFPILAATALAAALAATLAGCAPDGQRPATGGQSASSAAGTPADLARCSQSADPQVVFSCPAVYALASLPPPPPPEEGASRIALRYGIFKPAGPGPFPAIVVLAACDGLRTANNMPGWGAAALRAGYVVFVLDSFRFRGYPSGVCPPIWPPFNSMQLGARDAFEALDYLATQPYVDATRVGAIGFSIGARSVYQLASPDIAKAYSREGRRFAGLVAVYGECFFRLRNFNFVARNSDGRLLALLGDKDEDGDVRECLPRLQAAKDAGAPFEWHVYPGIGHAWDKPGPTRYMPYPGSPSGRVLFMYDARTTEDSMRRAFEFFGRTLAAR